MASKKSNRVQVDADGFIRTGVTDRDQLVQQHIDNAVDRRFEAEVRRWAVANTGRFPSRTVIRAEVAAEMFALCRALGGWVYQPAMTVFPFDGHRDVPLVWDE